MKDTRQCESCFKFVGNQALKLIEASDPDGVPCVYGYLCLRCEAKDRNADGEPNTVRPGEPWTADDVRAVLAGEGRS